MPTSKLIGLQKSAARARSSRRLSQAICSAFRAQAGLSIPHVDSCPDSFCSGSRIGDAGRVPRNLKKEMEI